MEVLLLLLSQEHVLKVLTWSLYASIGLASLHVALSWLHDLDKSDGVVSWTGISHALKLVKLVLNFTLLLVGLLYTKQGVKPVLLVAYEKIRAQFGETHPDDMSGDL